MTTDSNPPTNSSFGCDACWPAKADDAHLASSELFMGPRLIDESHCAVSLRTCGHCQQAYLTVFTERIDWLEGDDPQFVSRIPLTYREAAELAAHGAISESSVGRIGVGRKCLRHDAPARAPASTYWGTGISVGPHD